MRPAKVVLCVGTDEERMSLRVFLLRTWKYKTLAASTAKEALAILNVLGRGLTGEVDVMIVDRPLEDLDAEIFAQVKRDHPQLRTLVTSNHSGWYDPLSPDVLLPKGLDSPAELLERIRCLVARKRGPKVLRTVLDASREDNNKKPVVSCALPATRKSVARNRKVA